MDATARRDVRPAHHRDLVLAMVYAVTASLFATTLSLTTARLASAARVDEVGWVLGVVGIVLLAAALALNLFLLAYYAGRAFVGSDRTAPTAKSGPRRI